MKPVIFAKAIAELFFIGPDFVSEGTGLRKLKKAVAVSGICSGVPEENSEKIAENCYPNREML